MKKLAIVMCLCLAFTFVACGEDQPESKWESSDVASSVLQSNEATMSASSDEIDEESSEEESMESEENADSISSEETSSESSEEAQPVGLQYELHSGIYYDVVGFGVCEDENVVIPSTYKGLPVKVIRTQVFYGREDIKSIVIGENVTHIESYAFSRCFNLESVTIGKNVEMIDHHAFLSCESLKEITIPAKVNFLGSNMFNRCVRLKRVYLENKTGWIVYEGVDPRKRELTEDELTPETAADYFTDRFVRSGWQREN